MVHSSLKPYYSPLAGLLLGIVLTLGFKDIYPDLERRFRRHWNRRRVSSQNTKENELNDKDDDREVLEGFRNKYSGIVDGIEGTIGNTPLIRIKSLSEATGCEILGKAEVCL